MPSISQHVLLCPVCGMPPQQQMTKYGLRSHCCGFWSWDSKPLTNAATHEARKAAHAAFDPLWQSGRMKRTEAYKRLAEVMGMTRNACHISMMDAETAGRVLNAVEAIRLTETTPEDCIPD